METCSLFKESQHFLRAIIWAQLVSMELFQPSPCLCDKLVFLRSLRFSTRLPESWLCGVVSSWLGPECVYSFHLLAHGRLTCGARERSVGSATGFLISPHYTRNHCAWTHEDRDLPSLRPMTSGLHGPRRPRASE